MDNIIKDPVISYIILFFFMTIEGELALLIGIFVSELGYLPLPLTLLVALVAMYVGDYLWYWAGPYIEKFLPHRHIAKLLPFLDKGLKSRPTVTIMICKFIYFVNRFIILRARAVGLTPRQYMKADIIGGGIWFVLMSALGIIFSASYYLLKDYLRFAEVGLLLAIVLMGIAEHYLGAYFRVKLNNLFSKSNNNSVDLDTNI